MAWPKFPVAMMDALTLFLAKLIGLYCLILAGALMLRRRETIATVAAIAANPGMIMIAGVMALGAGLAIVLGHPDLTGSALAVCVTAIGWVMAAKGALLLILPNARLQALYRAIA